MGLFFLTNVESLWAQRHLSTSTNQLSRTQENLASGRKVRHAQDDPAGLAISEQWRVLNRAATQNIKNAEYGLNELETADGALRQITEMVIRMRELAMISATDTVTDRERGYLDSEVQSLKEELLRITESTKLTLESLLTGEGGDVNVQIGPSNLSTDYTNVAPPHEVTLEYLDLTGTDVLSAQNARKSLSRFDVALSKVAATRGSIGASESRLASTLAHLQNYSYNLEAGTSQIRDTDFAKETAEMAKYQILNQSGTAILAQANNVPQLALKLLS